VTSLSVGIIGAGPAGLTAGYILGKDGVRIEIIESDPVYVGGISRTVAYKGFRFDIGGHRFFSKSAEIENLWSEILPDDMIVRDRLSRIYYKEKFYNYPLEMNEVIRNLGKLESALCLLSYLKRKILPQQIPQNLEEWVTVKFGSRLYRTFFKSYTEKVWGRPCTDIAADWAAQRIKGLSLTTAAVTSLLSSIKQNANIQQSQKIKTLITEFRYPRLGPGMMWEKAADRIISFGGRIIQGTCAESLSYNSQEKQWYINTNDERGIHGPYDHVISSAPLGGLIQAINLPLPAEAIQAAKGLRYRDFLLVALILRKKPTFPDQWLYIHDPSLKVGRIQNFQNWSPEMVDGSGKLCYGMEYFCNEADSLWSLSDQDLISLATKELIKLSLASGDDVLDGCVVKQAKAYPVYDEDYQIKTKIIQDCLATHCPNLHVIGRNGMHRYNNQDHSMMTGILTARNILSSDCKYNTWLVNQDAEYIEG